jgi:hypothetical protein
MVEKKSIYDHTEPMLTDGPVASNYQQAAAEYNRMALASGYVGVPATLHDALYKTRHGEADIRQAVDIANSITRSLADGLVSLMLVCRMRQEHGWKSDDKEKL